MTDTNRAAVATDAGPLDEAPCGFVSFADDGRILFANTTLAERLGATRDELAGEPVESIFTLGTRIFYQTHLQPLLRIQSSVAEVKLELRRKDGRGLPVMVNMAERDWEVTSLLQVAVFVQNLFDRQFALLQFTGNNAPLANRYSNPRTIGANVLYRW